MVMESSMCGMRILKLGAFPYLLLLAVQRGGLSRRFVTKDSLDSGWDFMIHALIQKTSLLLKSEEKPDIGRYGYYCPLNSTTSFKSSYRSRSRGLR